MSSKNHEFRDILQLLKRGRLRGGFTRLGNIQIGRGSMKVFGERLAELRREKHVTQKQLGEFLCVSGNTVHAWESDKQEPSLTALVALADYFDISLDYLLGREEY